MRFEIGQSVWRATWDSSTSYVTCPDCGGSGRLRVTFDDDTLVSIECRNCSAGFNPPTGRVKVYDRKARAVLTFIKGFEVEGTVTRWRTDDCYIVDDCDLFDNEADALAAATVKAEQADHEERQRVFMKEKDTRTWAWNANYHRQCIRRAKQEIEYHSAKLAVASVKAKQDKA